MAVGVVCTGTVFQAYVYKGVPPDTTAVAVPSVKPKQVIFVEVAVTENAGGSGTTIDPNVTHPVLSVTVTL